MGVTFSCSAGNLDDLAGRLESLLVRSVSSGSIDGNAEHAILKSFGSSRKMIVEGSLSFRGRDLETMISFSTPSDVEGKVIVTPAKQMSRETDAQLPTPDSLDEKKLEIPPLEPGNHISQAALKLQKVYKSFRTRRQLADCAVLVEQRWWKLLDFAELKRSSISFFDIERPETAVSRWSRARTRVAKVGKGLVKDEKARKLALQHWLEAIDPRHRYGHNLQFYYAKWLHCESRQPFFYWLDIGEGKEVSLDRCPRPKLQQQCIKYLGPTERQAYEVVVKDGTFFHKQTWELLDTRRGPKNTKWIFVLSTSKTLYVGQKTKGAFQHSSFLAGGATLSAGRLIVEDGILKAVWPHSGHYLPTEENFEEFMLFLVEHNVDLSIVQKSPTDEDEEAPSKKMSSTVSAPHLTQVADKTNIKISSEEKIESSKQDCSGAKKLPLPFSNCPRELNSEISRLEVAKREDVPAIFKKEEQQPGSNCSICSQDSTSDGYVTAEEVLSDDEFMVSKQNLYDEDQEAEVEDAIPKDKIVQRINSHKGLKSYQLAHQLSCKWTTGAGPRIGCMRDYPSELQFLVLEEANLSPRSSFSSPRRSAQLSPKTLTPKNSCRDTVASRSPLYPEQAGTP